MSSIADPETPSQRWLEEEASHFYRSLFNGELPAEIRAGYVRAHRYYCSDETSDLRIRALVERQLDVEALELVLRRRHPLLTRKLRTLLYLAEVTPAHYHRFNNPANHRIRGWMSLVHGAFRTVYKYALGKAILRRNPEILRD